MTTKERITIGITAHVDAGKTTLSEAMLYLAGELSRPGRVDHGTAFLDDDPIERERGITIFSRQARFDLGKEVTLIDTPGHVDFSAEMERSLWVLDYGLLVISGSEGVQAHTKTLARMLKERGIPIFVFVNKMDIAIKSKEELTAAIKSELEIPAVDFSGADARTEEFIDDATLTSQGLSEAVLENMSKDAPEMLADDQISKAIAQGEVVPVIFGSALKMDGVSELMDAIRRYTKMPEYGEAFGARVYKTMTGKDGEKLSFIKITGGSLKVKDTVTIKNGGKEEVAEAKINQIRLYSGGRFQTVDAAGPGTMCAVTGSGSLLPGAAFGAESPVTEYSSEPFMVYSVMVPGEVNVHDAMEDIKTLAAEDPALGASWSDDGSEILIKIMGEVQLKVLQQIIKERFGYDVSFGQGKVLYLETITDTYEGVGHFEPLRHYAEVHLVIEPGERNSGVVITSDVAEDELALNWQRLIWTHLEEKAHRGVLTGSPLTDVHISIAAGKAHLKHTEGGDFREATYRAVRNALMQAKRDGKVMLLEPWCEYEIALPAKDMGRAATDIKQMGGSQDSMEQRDDATIIKGKVPAAKIQPYRQVLTGYTSGEGRIQITRCGYEAAVDAEKIIEEIGYDAERDTDNPADSVFVNHSGSDIVKWDEVPEHMHLASVLSKEKGEKAESREEAKQRTAVEKDLKKIFEMTYGKEKPKIYKERKIITSEEIKARPAKKAKPKEEKSPLLLIDGYNLIFADPELKELAGRDMGAARDSLIERLENYAGYTGMEVRIIFDAYNVVPGEGSRESYTGVDAIYTAAGELADVKIGQMAKAEKDRRIYVVSSDRLVQQDAWMRGAMRISAGELLNIIRDTEEEIRSEL